MFVVGTSQAEVARRVGVSRTAVHYWYIAWKKKGTAGLNSTRGVFGRMPRLTEVNIRAVRSAILAGPRTAGFPTDMWTLSRITMIIKRVASVSYHPNHVWRVLHAMGFTSQIPSAKPKERDEMAIRRWRNTAWPAMQKRGSKPMPA